MIATSLSVRLLACLAALAVAGCSTLPRATPTAGRIEATETDEVNRLIVPLTIDIAKSARGTGTSGFPSAWQTASTVDPTQLGAGDQIEVNVWEPTARPLIAGSAGGGGAIRAVVSRDGFVTLPFAKPVKARGLSPDELASEIEAAMTAMSTDVQASVQLLSSKSREVTVQGKVGRAGVYALDDATLRLAGMLAQAGVVADNPEKLRVDVTRAGKTHAVGLAELYSNAKLDLPLRAGDRIVVRPVSDRYILLGASGGQAELSFQGVHYTLLQALAQGGGLRDDAAASKGIYVFRYEPEERARAMLGALTLPDFPVVAGRRPVIYRLNMGDPSAVFAARLFPMRDGDTIVVTNAPFTELRKVLGVFSSVAQPANDLSGL